jgi:hypothetical protein
MQAPRRTERSHELTSEERSRGGLVRAARIRTAKLDAMAEAPVQAHTAAQAQIALVGGRAGDLARLARA